MRRSIAIMVLLGAVCGCERSPQQQASPPATQSTARLAELSPLRCELSIVAPLLPKRRTHLAVDPASNIYFSQETEDGRDGVFVIGSSDISTATPLSSVNILAELRAKGSGNIQSITAAGDGNLYFYFTGGNNRETIACFGRLEGRGERLRILADQRHLTPATGMGPTLALARGTVVAAGPAMWLWLRHTDASSLFRLRLRDISREGLIELPPAIHLRSADGTLRMTRTGLELAHGPAETMLLLDTYTAAIWKIHGTGAADVAQTLVGLPQLISLPGANSLGDIVFFAAHAERIEPRVEERVAPVELDTYYPSLLILREGKLTSIPRDDIHVPSGFSLFTMQLQQIVYEPGRDTYLGYDAASGQIVRLRLSAKQR